MRHWLLCALLVAAPLHAQDRAGATGAQVLQFLPGSRAPALSGAYTAIAGDADALFYNPAGVANVKRAGTLAYERYVSDVAFGSIAAATRAGAFTVGAAIAFLDAGSIREVVPDPDFGGSTGQETGNTVSASESAVRLVAALPIHDGRLRAGAALGFVATAIAEQRQSAPLLDLGGQYDMGAVTIGASLRNLGTGLSGDADDELPTEARLGASTQFSRGGGLSFTGTVELVSRLSEGTTTVAGGVEAGFSATAARPFAVLGRLGLDAEDNQLGSLRAGATVGFRDFAFDYTYQSLEFFGSVHRFGVRITRLR
ncbi:MAG TPA: hypothetical protein VGD49_08180 [Longimicrobiales bacterium]